MTTLKQFKIKQFMEITEYRELYNLYFILRVNNIHRVRFFSEINFLDEDDELYATFKLLFVNFESGHTYVYNSFLPKFNFHSREEKFFILLAEFTYSTHKDLTEDKLPNGLTKFQYSTARRIVKALYTEIFNELIRNINLKIHNVNSYSDVNYKNFLDKMEHMNTINNDL